MKKSILLILTCVCAVLLSACGDINKEEKKDVSSKNKLKIYTTAFAFKSFTEQIGGKYVEAESIYPPGADMHSFEPTQKEMINIAKGDLFVYSSEDMDPVAKTITNSINNDNLKLPLAKNLSEKDFNANHEHEKAEHSHEHEGHEHEETAHEHEGHDHSDKADEHEGHDHGKNDPHVWLDPEMNKIFAKEIRDDLTKKDPKHQDYYDKNYQKLVKDIEAIDEQMKAITKDTKRDKVVISHDSIGYLANRYGFEQVGVSGMNNEEPSQRDLMDIVKNIKATGQPYVLYEQNISSKVTDVIQKESDSTPLGFHNMATLSKSEADKDNISYQSLMKKNIKSLDKALND
ncbi:ABC transporter substrate-binding protein [Staphylococcus equorum]|uniref:metal ABC transporter solute-binding protein, Zn/Mn family n=1 Tax=Staphylococcus equorum TaxID=246432 RepID=UPI000852F2A1|nr:zinc ABC transporter substrate-binding protein [Staphylococcus equorum]MDG0822855.1 zinc ABC transporter substrate-binding protein [Staphylococcus equorum]MDG0836645.1 zinc ABC transporter substrate-binding protein [Staphylococcus equorum]OEK66084.1 ABC transporter substrate-binding protein [Staphylococcus equorum]